MVADGCRTTRNTTACVIVVVIAATVPYARATVPSEEWRGSNERGERASVEADLSTLRPTSRVAVDRYARHEALASTPFRDRSVGPRTQPNL